jgi:hypothetical protein
MITGQVCPYKKKVYTVTVNSYFLDMFNAQYMFAVCFALLDYSEWKAEKKCFRPVLCLSSGSLTQALGNTLAWLISSVFLKIITQSVGKLTHPLHKTHDLKFEKL